MEKGMEKGWKRSKWTGKTGEWIKWMEKYGNGWKMDGKRMEKE